MAVGTVALSNGYYESVNRYEEFPMTQPHDRPPDPIPATDEHPHSPESVPAPPHDPAASRQGSDAAHLQGGRDPQTPGYRGAEAPIHRPGAAIAAAVFAFLQAVITVLATVIMLRVVNEASDTVTRQGGTLIMLIGWTVAITQLTSAVLLIVGAIRLVHGRGRAALTSGIALDLIISLGYLITAVVAISDQHRSAFGGALDGVSRAFASILANDVVDIQSILTDDGVDIRIMLLAIIVAAVLLAIMPMVSLILSGGAPVSDYLRDTYRLRHEIRKTRTG
jgi:hypothetical protein